MKHSPAFTLVELSIVITIISLIVGAMFAGQSVIHSSRLQSVERDLRVYTEAAKMFQSKYKELPGDLPTASSFWAGAGDGNGDGAVGISNGHPSTVQSANLEPLYFWQHLYKAGFVSVPYTGTAPTNKLVSGTNVAQTRFDGSVIYMRYALDGADTDAFDVKYGNVFIFGMPLTNSNTPPIAPAITTYDGYEIDQKFDDGKPGTGHILSFTNASSSTPDCATGDEATAEYKVSHEGLACSLIYITGL